MYINKCFLIKLDMDKAYHGNPEHIKNNYKQYLKFKALYCQYCCITDLPNVLSSLILIEIIFALKNYIKSLPKNFNNLCKIIHLKIQFNSLTSIVIKIKKLSYKNYSKNNITDIKILM